MKFFRHFPGYLNTPVTRGRDNIFRTRPVTTMRKGDWKIQLYHEEWLLNRGRENLANNHAVEIYNLKEDEGERVNLASVNTQKRDELLADLLKWMKETNAPWPALITENHKPILNEGDDSAGEE